MSVKIKINAAAAKVLAQELHKYYLRCTDVSVLMGESFFKTRGEYMQELLLRHTEKSVSPPCTAVDFRVLCAASQELGLSWKSPAHFVLACEDSRSLAQFCGASLPAAKSFDRSGVVDTQRMLGRAPSRRTLSTLVGELEKAMKERTGVQAHELGDAPESCRKLQHWEHKLSAAAWQGCTKEAADLKRAGAKKKTAPKKMSATVKLRDKPRVEFELIGIVDGFDADGRVMETKRRSGKMRGVPESEKIQMEMYMLMRELQGEPADYCTHVENCGDEQRTTKYRHNKKRRTRILVEIQRFFENLAEVIASDEPYTLSSHGTGAR